MPTLSQLSPLRRLALLRHVPFWAQALAVCALFAVAGMVALDDYGVTWDETDLRNKAIATVHNVAIGNVNAPPISENIVYRYYGLAFEMPLLLLERALGLQDTRHIYLTRHLLTHLFFVAGGFACGMLAYRMIGSRWIALLAMLLFLIHPRLYAHSFFNTKDIPFAAMLAIALYLTHRAFRKDAIGAFLLCGIVVGLAINLRPFALMLLPMILAMRALDLWHAGREERKRILIASATFLAVALGTVYIIHPYYWENPLRFIEGARALSQHPVIILSLFMGEIYRSDAVPWNYIPVWFAITAPPVSLALGVLGAAAVCWQAIIRPLDALRDREIRFRVMLLGCFALPVAAAIILQFNIYHDWRQMYFLWGPFCLLAAVGLHHIANIRIGMGIWNLAARLPCKVRRGGRLHMARRTFAYGAAGVGLITTATAMAALHPYEYVYFNPLTDTRTPGALVNRYDMDYWQMARRQSLEHLLVRYPDGALRVASEVKSEKVALILPQGDRDRIATMGFRDRNADFYFRQLSPDQPAIHSIQAYGSVIESILAPNSDFHINYYRAAYNDAAANGTLLARADFDIYAHNGELRYLKENCGPLAASAGSSIFLHIFPADSADLPARRREFGFENRDFPVIEYSGFFDGKCILKRSLPNYPIVRIRTGQNMEGKVAWRVDIDFAAHADAQAVYEGIIAGDYGRPVAQSDFAMYLRGNGLAYLKDPCHEGDTDEWFFLHIIPADLADLSVGRREAGFANLDFQFADHGARIGDICVAERELPGYAIERIRTGQFVSGEGRVWGVEFPAAQ